MFSDDTNLFYSHKHIKSIFKTVNNELILTDDYPLTLVKQNTHIFRNSG